MIEVADVRKSYRSGDRTVEALRGITCRIPKGRFAFIVGPSGSGKSTLLYLLGALDRPDTGLIRVEGTGSAEHAPEYAGALFERIKSFRAVDHGS